MEKYVQQLIEDMVETALSASTGMNIANIDDELEQVERYISGPQEKISVIVGIDKATLPPIEKLTEEQASRLYKTMEQLLACFNFVPDFPEDLPDFIKYRLMRIKWDSKQPYVTIGQVHLEFCHYEPEECPFPQEFCECKRF